MAILGFHLVVTLVVLTIITKLGSRISIVQLYLVNGLRRYMAPTNQELRSLLPASREKTNPRHRRRQREEEDEKGFNVPKQLPLQLRTTQISVDEMQRFPLFPLVHWLSLFVPLCLVVYVMSEIFLYFFPTNGDTNVSVIWLIIAIGFIFQVLCSLTAWLWTTEDERGVLLSFAAIYFLFSVMFTLTSDRYFDTGMLSAYDRFCANTDKLMVEIQIKEVLDSTLKNPIMLYVSLSTLFSFLSATLVFPNFRFAIMYTNALEMASRRMKFLLHISFLMPVFTILLYANPVKNHLVNGPRKLISEEQLDIVRVYSVVLTVILRAAIRRPHLQAHLDLAHEKVQQLQRETGHVRNIHLQTLIIRYFSYLSAAILQYFAPVLLSFFFALLLKTTGNLSWLGEPTSDAVVSSTVTMGAIRGLFDSVVCRAIWTYALLITTVINFSLSLIGLIYTSQFIKE